MICKICSDDKNHILDGMCMKCHDYWHKCETKEEKTKIPFEWEKINSITWRAKVFGGWLIDTVYYRKKEWFDDDNPDFISNSTTFIEDKNHEWEIEQ